MPSSTYISASLRSQHCLLLLGLELSNPKFIIFSSKCQTIFLKHFSLFGCSKKIRNTFKPHQVGKIKPRRSKLLATYWRHENQFLISIFSSCLANLDDVFVGATLLWITVLGVLEQNAVHVGARILEQLVGTVEHDQCNLAVAQNAQFVRFLHQTELALRERNLHSEKKSRSQTLPSSRVAKFWGAVSWWDPVT